MVAQTLPLLLAVLNALVAAGAFASALVWSRVHPRPRCFVAWVVGGVVTGVAVYLLLPEAWAWEVATPLREGGTLNSANTVFGRTPSTGPNYEWFSHVAHWAAAPPVIGIVRVNVALTASCLFFLAAAASYVFATWWGPVVVLGVAATTPIVLIAAVAEQPGAILATYFFAGSVAVAASHTAGGPRRTVVFWVTAATVLTATVLAGATRIETVILGAGPSMLLFARAAAGTERVDAWSRSIGHGAHELFGRATRVHWVPTAVAALVAASWMLGTTLDDPDVRSAVRGLNPFDPTVLTLPASFAPVASVGAGALLMLGLVRTMRGLVATAALPIAFLCIYKVYYASAHDGAAIFEMLRYQVLVAFPAAFIGLFGWHEAIDLAKRISPAMPGRLVAVGCLVALLTWWRGPNAYVTNRDMAFEAAFEGTPPGGWAGHNVQREVLFLARALDDRPDCTLVAPYARRSGVSEDGEYTLFRFAGYVVLSHDDSPGSSAYHVDTEGLLDLLAQSDHGCVLYFEGLDCNIEGFDLCPDVPVSAELIEHRLFRSRQWGEPDEWGPFAGEIELRLYAVDSPEHAGPPRQATTE